MTTCAHKNGSEYQVEALKSVKRVKKVKVPVYKQVAFTASYAAFTAYIQKHGIK